MGRHWRQDKEDTDRYLPVVKAICGVYLLDEPAEVEDQLHATDLTVLYVNGVRIAVRIRKFADWADYHNEFTIRLTRPMSGARTELHKIYREGWGDLMFYGFANADQDALYDWFIGDLDVFRVWLRHEIKAARLRARLRGGPIKWPWMEVRTHDRSATFAAFKRAPLQAAGFEVADRASHTVESRVVPPGLAKYVRRPAGRT